jgi:hypothetical protein
MRSVAEREATGAGKAWITKCSMSCRMNGLSCSCRALNNAAYDGAAGWIICAARIVIITLYQKVSKNTVYIFKVISPKSEKVDVFSPYDDIVRDIVEESVR